MTDVAEMPHTWALLGVNKTTRNMQPLAKPETNLPVDTIKKLQHLSATNVPNANLFIYLLYDAGWPLPSISRALGCATTTAHSKKKQGERVFTEYPNCDSLKSSVPPPPGALNKLHIAYLQETSDMALGARNSGAGSIQRRALRDISKELHSLDQAGVPMWVLAKATGTPHSTIRLRINWFETWGDHQEEEGVEFDGCE